MTRYLLLPLVSLILMGMQPASAPFELKVVNFGPKPIVKGNLNGKTAYFLLDTGADITLLDLGAHERFGFKPMKLDDPNKIHGISGTSTRVSETSNVNLYLGPQRIHNRFLACDLTYLVTSLKTKTAYRISGIIGSDVMKRYGFIINYAKHSVLIEKPRGKAKKSSEYIANKEF